MISERQSRILNAIIDEFISTAIPVSSGRVFEIKDWAISCPTIRNEMADLTQLGYLEQPHTSSGRVPTQKGYRFFVDNVLKNSGKQPGESRVKLEDHFDDINSFADDISEKVKSAVVFTSKNRGLKHIGLKRVFENPEFQTRKEIIALLEEIERIERLDALQNDLLDLLDDEITIFIGSENPVFSGHDYGMISKTIDDSFISIIGPMRMDYARGINLFNKLF